MAEPSGPILEGIFAVSKPPNVSSGEFLQSLQSTFAESRTFAPLLHHAPKRTKDASTPFKMGHAGTLDPLASGILIIGIGRGTKSLLHFLDSTKTYETVVLFGKSTDTYDITGKVVDQAQDEGANVSKELVEENLSSFRGLVRQVPPAFSALKVGGKKALEYAKEGKEVVLESREVNVHECELLEWWQGGQHEYSWPVDAAKGSGSDISKGGFPAARVRLTVSSGFYVRSFAHDLGVACNSYGTMATLHRSRQANYTVDAPAPTGQTTALVHEDFLDEQIWGPKISEQLCKWMLENPREDAHVNGRDANTRQQIAEEKTMRPRQRFRGEWVAETKAERRKQQGGKWKGKWGKKLRIEESNDEKVDFDANLQNA